MFGIFYGRLVCPEQTKTVGSFAFSTCPHATIGSSTLATHFTDGSSARPLETKPLYAFGRRHFINAGHWRYQGNGRFGGLFRNVKFQFLETNKKLLVLPGQHIPVWIVHLEGYLVSKACLCLSIHLCGFKPQLIFPCQWHLWFSSVKYLIWKEKHAR